MKLLFDANFSPRILQVMRAVLDRELEIIHSTQYLPQDAQDPEIFALCKDKDAILLTKDRKVMRRPHEVEAYRASGIGAFIFTGTANRRLIEEARFMLEVIEDVIQEADRNTAPYAYRVTDRKKIETF